MSWIKHIFRVLRGWHWNFSAIKIPPWLASHQDSEPEVQRSWRLSPHYFFPPLANEDSNAAPETQSPSASRMIIPSLSFRTPSRWTTLYTLYICTVHRAGEQHWHQHRHRRGAEDQRRDLQHHLRYILQCGVAGAETEPDPRVWGVTAVRVLILTWMKLCLMEHNRWQIFAQAIQLLGSCDGSHESWVHQRSLGPKHFHLQSQNLQSDRRSFKAGWTLDRHGQERVVQPGHPHHLHLSHEVWQVSSRHTNL